MKTLTLPALALSLFSPLLVSAQGLSLFNFFANFIGFANTVIIPFLLGIAFLFFVINTVRYFVFEGQNTESHEKAKSQALYSIMAFVIIISFWGIINVLVNFVGLKETARCPDYLKKQGACVESGPAVPNPLDPGFGGAS